MENKAKKYEGPACACGKSDLYIEILKKQEDSKKSFTDSLKHNQPDKQDDIKFSTEK